MKICQRLIILIAKDMCNSTGRTVWSSFENIAWTTWSFQRELCKFQRWKVQSFWGLHHYFIHISQGIAKHQKNSSQFFQWVFEYVWNYLSRFLSHTRMSWMVSRLLTKSQQKLPSQQSRMLWRILGQLLHYLDMFGSKKNENTENTMILRT